MSDTIFGKIISGEIPADKLFEDEHCICIKDVAPKAPTHVLIIPKRPIPKLADATPEDKELLGHLMLKVGDIQNWSILNVLSFTNFHLSNQLYLRIYLYTKN